jgi:hypothetical protein
MARNQSDRPCGHRWKGGTPLIRSEAGAIPPTAGRVRGKVEQRLVLGQEAVDSKSNEITAIPALLAGLDLSGGVVSIDAAG